jgi:hypothetical protein
MTGPRMNARPEIVSTQRTDGDLLGVRHLGDQGHLSPAATSPGRRLPAGFDQESAMGIQELTPAPVVEAPPSFGVEVV